MSVATVATIVNYLDNGTPAGPEGEGLKFDDFANTSTVIAEIREDNASHLWMVCPVTVIGVDGPHYGCCLLITFCYDDDNEHQTVFGAVDRKGQPIAWQEVS